MSLLGLDIGTTGAKATLFSDEGIILSYAYQEYAVENPRPGWFELSPLTVWEAVRNVIRRACGGNGTLKAICVSSLGEAFVCLDEKGGELGGSAIYMDQRGKDECAELAEKLGASIMKSTGHPPQPMYSICKLMWLRRYAPQIYKKTKYIHFFGDYILHKLGGGHVTDYSLAARSMAFDVVNKKWDEAILDAAGLDAAILPEAHVAGTVIGCVSSSAASELGISANTKLVLGAHDQIMCAVGAGVLECGQAVNGIGTVDCITPVYGTPRLTQSMADGSYNCMPYIFEGTYVTYAFTMTGGSLLKWFRDNFARLDKTEAEKTGDDIYAILDASMPNEPTDLFVLPHFAGSPSPNVDAMAKGAIVNLDFGTKREDIYRACMEGETFEMKRSIEALKRNGIAIESLRTVGGGSRSEQFMQIRADILQRPVITMACEEAGTLGTAILAGTATGVYASVGEACDKLVRTRKAFEPAHKNSAYYESRFEKYIKLYDLLKQVR